MAAKVGQLEATSSAVFRGKRTRKGAKARKKIKEQTHRAERRRAKAEGEDAPRKREFDGYEW